MKKELLERRCVWAGGRLGDEEDVEEEEEEGLVVVLLLLEVV